MTPPSTHYRLRCLACDAVHAETATGFLLCCDCASPAAGLLRAEYAERRFAPAADLSGAFRYASWLPVRRARRRSDGGTVALPTTALAAHLGLQNLLVLFNGYWPERGAQLMTCAFKELEAQAVTARLGRGETQRLVVASAGNTGRAFHHVCSQFHIPALIVVPQKALPYLWSVAPRSSAVTLVAVAGDADYYDAIRIAGLIADLSGYLAEGGAQNVARRDGMGTVMLTGVEHTDALPDHYFQAVGSGTGAIAAWEMAQRLVADGGYGDRLPQLHLAQNAPFTIMTDAWNAGRRALGELDAADAKRRIDAISAPVLSNRKPPYGLAGGLFDALSASRGRMYSIANTAAQQAAALFLATEGCDLDPAAAVALASLQQAVASGAVQPKDSVFLNITGGGLQKLRVARSVRQLVPDLVVDQANVSHQSLERALAQHADERYKESA